MGSTFNCLDHFRDDDVQIAHNTVVGDLEYRSVLIGVDRDDLRGILHAGQVLDRTGNAAAYEERGTDRNTRLTDLALVFAVAEVDSRAASAYGAAESVGEIVE